MAQSKQELAERNAKIRAEKLRENLAKRKQQTRERKTGAVDDANSQQDTQNTGENSLG